MTPTLFHGPEARNEAVRLSEKIGRPLRDPIGDEGLKVDDSREIVEIARYPGVGDRPPSLVVGPLDAASPEAADALLKTLEELTEAPLRLIVWADHLSGVIKTIRSRTRPQWCPAVATTPNPFDYVQEDAERLAEALVNQDAGRILGILENIDKGTWVDLLQAVTSPLADRLDSPRTIEVWVRIRRLLDGRGSVITAADALLPGEM